MAIGRQLKLKKNNVVLAGLRSKSFGWGGESVDLTGDDDLGKRVLDAVSAQEQIDLSCDGIMKDAIFRDLVLGSGSKMLEDITLEWPLVNPSNGTPGALTGNFRVSSYEEGASYNDAITFSLSLESSGAWVYTPEAA